MNKWLFNSAEGTVSLTIIISDVDSDSVDSNDFAGLEFLF